MNRACLYACVALTLLTAGCNDGAYSGTPVAPGPTPGTPVASSPPPPLTVDCGTLDFDKTTDIDALPGGIWVGSVIDCANNARQDIATAMISEDGQFRIIDENNHLLTGVLQTSGNRFTGGGIDIAPLGIEYFSGPSTNLFVVGSVDERNTLDGRWGTEWGNYGYFRFVYVQESYERPTPLADLAGVWPTSMTVSGQPVEGVWTIEPDGRFSGQDASGCLLSGQLSLIDDRYSIVAVQLDVTGCELTGSYAGLAQRDDPGEPAGKAITVSVDDGTRSLRISLAIEQP